MNDYILFIDTVTSDMPSRWNAPTSKVSEWPYILQIAWILCESDGKVVQERNFYIRQKNVLISDSLTERHGITPELLEEKGESREVVLNTLGADFNLYKPLIVGHFLEFDKKMIEVGFSRETIDGKWDQLPKFCTMLYTRKTKDVFGGTSYMSLEELYHSVFKIDFPYEKDAYGNAKATKECFFELVVQGKIRERTIRKQQRAANKRWELPLPLVITASVILGAALISTVLFFLL